MLYEDRALGIALLASALVNGALAAVFFRRSRDLASLLWATALALAAVGTAQLLSEATLTVAWAAEAAVLAWLAERLREPRFRIAALAWLALALLHSLAFDAPVSLLFHETAHSRLRRAEPARADRGRRAHGPAARRLRARARQELGRVRRQRHAPRPPPDRGSCCSRSRACSRSRPRR